MNNLPEKLYIALDELTEDERTFVLDHDVDYPICTEYTRTDAFIEKATDWLENYIYEYLKMNRTWNEPDYDPKLIGDFRNYMKGE